MTELEELERRVEVLEEMLVLRVASFEDNLDLNSLRQEDARNHLDLVAVVDKRVRRRRRSRMTEHQWTGDLAQLRRQVKGKASLVLDHGRLTVVCQGKTFQLATGDWLEITEDGRVRPCRSPEGADANEESLQFYREAAR